MRIKIAAGTAVRDNASSWTLRRNLPNIGRTTKTMAPVNTTPPSNVNISEYSVPAFPDVDTTKARMHHAVRSPIPALETPRIPALVASNPFSRKIFTSTGTAVMLSASPQKSENVVALMPLGRCWESNVKLMTTPARKGAAALAWPMTIAARADFLSADFGSSRPTWNMKKMTPRE